MSDYLKEILVETANYVEALKNSNKYSTKKTRVSAKSFSKQLKKSGISVIAEVKRGSPSKGVLAEITDPIALVETYAKGGADAISVLTNKSGFNGSIQDLTKIATSLKGSPVAVLRKDFILDPVQLYEAVDSGADAVLLIVAITGDKTRELFKLCQDLNLEALIEVHNQSELDIALTFDANLIGINNRNLTTFVVDTDVALTLKKQIPNSVITVAESGIKNTTIAKQYIQAGFDALLIGEALVTSKNPAQFIQEIKQC